MAGCGISSITNTRKIFVSIANMVRRYRTRWINRIDDATNSNDIIDYMRVNVMSIDFRNDLSSSDAMRRMDLSIAFQKVILGFNHENVRLIASNTYWILKTWTIHWKTLLKLISNLKVVVTRSGRYAICQTDFFLLWYAKGLLSLLGNCDDDLSSNIHVSAYLLYYIDYLRIMCSHSGNESERCSLDTFISNLISKFIRTSILILDMTLWRFVEMFWKTSSFIVSMILSAYAE